MTKTPIDPPGEVFPITPTERVAKVVLALADGAILTKADVAEMTGLTLCAALRLLENVSRVTPMRDECGVWWMLPRGDSAGREDDGV